LETNVNYKPPKADDLARSPKPLVQPDKALFPDGGENAANLEDFNEAASKVPRAKPLTTSVKFDKHNPHPHPEGSFHVVKAFQIWEMDPETKMFSEMGTPETNAIEFNVNGFSLVADAKS